MWQEVVGLVIVLTPYFCVQYQICSKKLKFSQGEMNVIVNFQEEANNLGNRMLTLFIRSSKNRWFHRHASASLARAAMVLMHWMG